MNLALGYAELERFVREASGTELKFGYESTDSIRVSYPVKVLGMTTDVGMSLRVLGVSGNDLRLALDGGGAMMNMALGMVGNFVREKLSGVATFGSDNNVTIHLDNVPKMKPVLEKLQLSDISFNQQAANVLFEMRSAH